MLSQKTFYKSLIYSGVFLVIVVLFGAARMQARASQSPALIAEGKQIFRFDTFGDEDFWGGQLRLHEAIEGEQFGGVGPGVSPETALAVGLKVDVEALPEGLRKQIKKGQVDLKDPAVTLALLKLNAVVGVQGFFNQDGSLSSVGITCALCHSTVDDSLAPGIGHRLDGWANRDLNVGAIIGLSPDLSPFEDLLGKDRATIEAVLNSWGPGKFDAELVLDGKAFNPQQVTDGVVTGTNVPGATLLPPAFGLAGVNLHTWTGWGSVTHWNAFVANLEMHGSGRRQILAREPPAQQIALAFVERSDGLLERDAERIGILLLPRSKLWIVGDGRNGLQRLITAMCRPPATEFGHRLTQRDRAHALPNASSTRRSRYSSSCPAASRAGTRSPRARPSNAAPCAAPTSSAARPAASGALPCACRSG